MRTKIDAFVRASTTLLLEVGQLEKRPSWSLVKNIAVELLQVADSVIVELTSEQGLLFILASSPSGSTRDSRLKLCFQRALLNLPTPGMLTLLSQFSTAELKDNLLPFVYESGNRGAITGYIAARLKVFVAPDVFQYFLSARTWTKTDLMNLTFLARPEDVGTICSQLDTAAANFESPAVRETFAEFRYILFNHTSGEPLLPDILPEAAPVKQSLPKQKVPLTMPANPSAKQTVPSFSPAITSPAELSKNPPAPLMTTKGKPLPVTVRSLIVPVIVVLVLLIVSMIFSTWYYSEPNYRPETVKSSSKAPQFWVDAVSQRPVTAKFLSADKDYRMGELYLTRDMHAEALKLFEDAISIDNGHTQAVFKSGYCRMQLGDKKGAIEIFKKILNQDPGYETVNLYMARIAIAANETKVAEKHFQAEYALKNDLNVGMEYANFLAKQGNQNAAMELIAALQERFPDKMLVLSQNSDAEKNEKEGPND